MDDCAKTLEYLRIRLDELADHSEDLYAAQKRNGLINDRADGMSAAYRNALGLVVELEEELKEKEKNNGWIDVNYRMPDELEIERANIGDGEGSEFLGLIKGGKIPTTLCLMDDGSWVDSRSVSYTVTHWRELPNPPKK